MEELQFTLGEGPSVDAFDRQTPTLASDVSSVNSGRRWPLFTPAAERMGVRAVFAFPLRAGVVREGVLTLYRTEQGTPTSSELADSLVYADAAVLVAFDAGSDLLDGTTAVGDSDDERRAEVHQAAGMVSVQLGTGVAQPIFRRAPSTVASAG